MKIAVCYRGHFRRTYVAEENIRYNVEFFKNLNNHKEKLLNNLDDVDIFFHTYESDKKEENKKLLDVLNPTNHVIEKIQGKKISDSIFAVNKLVDPTKYDFVFNIRFDLIFLKDFKDWNIKFSKFNFLFKDHPRPWERDKKTSDLMFAFDSKFHKSFQKSISSKEIRKDKMGSAHFIYNGLLENDMTDDDMHFLVDGHHTSYVKYKEFKGGFVSLNRGFHTDI